MAVVLAIVTVCLLSFHAEGQEEPSLMMAPLQAIDIGEGEAAILTDALLNSLVRTGAFQAVERRDMKELLNEMSLSLSDLMDQDVPAPDPGRLQSAQVACLGTVGKIGDSWILQARCADVQTGRLLGSTSLRCTGSIDCLLDLTERAARELAGLEPGSDSPRSTPLQTQNRSDTVPSSGSQQWQVVTNSDFARFIDAGGYENRNYWTETGWEFRRRGRLTKPAFWNNPNLNLPSQPVTGISYHEAEAYCLWIGSRLPTIEEAKQADKKLGITPGSDKFLWTADSSDMGHDCIQVIRKGRKTFSQKDIRDFNSTLITGGVP